MSIRKTVTIYKRRLNRKMEHKRARLNNDETTLLNVTHASLLKNRHVSFFEVSILLHIVLIGHVN